MQKLPREELPPGHEGGGRPPYRARPLSRGPTVALLHLSQQYKNIPKIKVLRMTCQFNMIFREYLRIYYAKITAGGAATWPRGWWAPPLGRAPYLVGPRWPSSSYPSTHLLPLSHTNPKNQLKHEFQPLLLRFSISLLKAPLTKLLGEIVPWYLTPPLVQLIFVLALYSLQICAA